MVFNIQGESWFDQVKIRKVELTTSLSSSVHFFKKRKKETAQNNVTRSYGSNFTLNIDGVVNCDANTPPLIVNVKETCTKRDTLARVMRFMFASFSVFAN